MKRLLGLALVASTAFSLSAMAAPEHARIRGTVTAIGTDVLKVKTADGMQTSVMLNDKTRYLKVLKSSLDNVDKDSYIGTATKNVGDQLVALEVVVFPPAMKGAGEGHYGWDKIPDTTLSGGGSTASTMTNGTVSTVGHGGTTTTNSTMTNGTVATTAAQGGAKKITVTYKGGEQTILVPPTAPIVTFAPGSKAELTDGATVFVNATMDDGKTTANSVAVGVDGVKPPM